MAKSSLKLSKKPLVAALGAAFLASSIAPMASAEANPFSATALSSGYDLGNFNSHGDGKHSEGGKAKEGKCGEGKCGEAKAGKAKEGKCGEGKCGEAKGAKASKEGKCGESKK